MMLDNETRTLLKDSAREWLKTEWPISKFRARRDRDGTVSVAEIWQGMSELGWSGLCVDTREDALGAEAVGIILNEAGKNLAASPLLTTGLIAASAINLSKKNPLISDIAEKIQQGLLISFAIDEGSHHDPNKISTIATKQGDSWVLNGCKNAVPFITSAALFMVVARIEEDGRLGLFFVEKNVTRCSAVKQIDCVESGSLIFEDVTVPLDAQLVPEEGGDLVNHILNRAIIGASAEILGVAESAFEMTVEYLKIREQFGQLIGSFQALQHRAAKMYVEIELTRSVVDAALLAIDADEGDLDAIASMSKVIANEALHLIANETIQLHGGVGMTDEHDAGLFIKRAHVLETLYGSTSYHKNRFAVAQGF